MSWNDTMRRILPSVKIDSPNGSSRTFEPHKTSGYGWRWLEQQQRWEDHHAGDFNYDVGPNGQTGVNLTHPALRSPVTGIVTNAGQGTVGRIAIQDTNGFTRDIAYR
jgi:hypothetical protein